MTSPHYDIVGIGNAIVDCLAHVDDAFLTRHTMEKGGMQLVEAATIDTLRAELDNARECSGGSVANSMAGLAEMGLNCAYLGRVADDALGVLFTDDMRTSGIAFHNAPARSGKPTASCVVCVTPDGERTMNTFIGACAELARDDIDEAMISNASMIYIEGYLWDAPAAKEAILHAISVAKQHNVRVAFTASDTFCVERHREEFLELITNHIDILFANEDEIKALYGVDAEQAATTLRDHVDIAAITRSASPAVICQGDTILHVPALPTTVVDTTGAGDLFAAGFLYGLIKGLSLEAAAQQGHKLASHIVSQLGARSETSLQALVA